MPWWATSNSPCLVAMAPEKEPLTWPNSSLSSSVGARAVQSQASSGRSLRRLRRCRARTTISLPVPLSPVISTVPSAGRHALDQGKHVLHRPALAEDPLEPLVDLQFAPQQGVLAHQRRALPDLAQDHLQLIGRERLAEVVGGALLHGLDGRVHGGMAGDDDHFGGDPGRLDLAEDLHAVDARHLQVQEDHVEVAGEGRLEAGLRVLAALHLVPVRAENPLARQCRSRGRRRSTGCAAAQLTPFPPSRPRRAGRW